MLNVEENKKAENAAVRKKKKINVLERLNVPQITRKNARCIKGDESRESCKVGWVCCRIFEKGKCKCD